MHYLAVSFPTTYDEASEIRLCDLLPEKEGMLFVLSVMHQVRMSQVEEIGPPTGDISA